MKGHITELALHFEDEDDRVASLVKLFFHELSKKGLVSFFFDYFMDIVPNGFRRN